MKVILVIAAAALISSSCGAPNEDGKKHGPHGPMKCDGTVVKFSEDITKAKKACGAKYMGKPDEAAKTKEQKGPHPNMTCLHVCEFQGFGLISTDGKVVKDNIGSFVKTNFPASVQDTLTTSWTACADESGANLAITADGKCDSYQPLVKCAMGALHKACKMEKPAA